MSWRLGPTGQRSLRTSRLIPLYNLYAKTCDNQVYTLDTALERCYSFFMPMPNIQRIRQILAASVVVITIGLIAVVLWRQTRGGAPAPPATPAAGVDMALKRFEFSEMQGSRLAWRLVSDAAEYEKQGGLARLTVVTITIHDEHDGTMTITAPRGIFDEKRQLVTLFDDVRGVSNKGLVMTGDLMHYASKINVITSEHPVTVVDGRMTLSGTGMRMTVKDGTVRFSGPVKSVIEGTNGKKR